MAFTLVELLTAIAIIGILAGILIPVASAVSRKSKMAQSISNVRQLGGLAAMYVSENRGVLPNDDFDTTVSDNWINVLWRMQYGSRTINYAPDANGRVLGGTIFDSPMQESVSSGDPVVRSYGWNGELRRLLSTRRSEHNRLVAPRHNSIMNPGRTLVLADTTSGSVLLATNGQLNFRNEDMAICLFADWHVDKLTSADVPPENTRVFWGGTEF